MNKRINKNKILMIIIMIIEGGNKLNNIRVNELANNEI